MEKKRGRPKKPKKELRSKPLRILLNPEERRAIDAAAKPMDVSTWARMELLKLAQAENRTPGG